MNNVRHVKKSKSYNRKMKKIEKKAKKKLLSYYKHPSDDNHINERMGFVTIPTNSKKARKFINKHVPTVPDICTVIGKSWEGIESL